MREIRGEFFGVEPSWGIPLSNHHINWVIPINGCIKGKELDGGLVMGAGLAKQVVDKYGDKIRYEWSKLLFMKGGGQDGPGLRPFYDKKRHLIAFPTKPAYHVSPDRWHLDSEPHPGWMCGAQTKSHWCLANNLKLILRNLQELVELIVVEKIKGPIVLPRLGCGLGGLSWDLHVGPWVHTLLKDDRFLVVDKNVRM